MKVLIRFLIISLLMSTSAANVTFAEMASTQTISKVMTAQTMSMTSDDMSAHCQGDDTHQAMDSYCMDHCAHLLALGTYSPTFFSDSPATAILDLILTVPTTEPSSLWRPPTLYS